MGVCVCVRGCVCVCECVCVSVRLLFYCFCVSACDGGGPEVSDGNISLCSQRPLYSTTTHSQLTTCQWALMGLLRRSCTTLP